MATADIEPSSEVPAALVEVLANDLNTSGAIAVLHELEKSKDLAGLKSGALLLGLLGEDLGEWVDRPGIVLDAFVEKLSAARQIALESKDFSEVDRLKAAYVEAGLEVKITKDGVVLVAGPEVDMSKLEGLL